MGTPNKGQLIFWENGSNKGISWIPLFAIFAILSQIRENSLIWSTHCNSFLQILHESLVYVRPASSLLHLWRCLAMPRFLNHVQGKRTNFWLEKVNSRCHSLIIKMDDGSCNHMTCRCGAEFCWLCLKEISDLHFLSPSGCKFIVTFV